ncbi:hypothetical protein LUZ60_003652 [Juncus effusus]|nr:hypothetical protein LUZ60_003652 [Juncus effusus]
MTYLLDKQEQVLLSTMDEKRLNVIFSTYIMDEKKRRVRIRMKVAMAIGVVVVFIAVGSIMVHLLEGLDWIDSFYLTVISVTTVGLLVARGFIYLTELRFERRNRKVANWVLRRKITVQDLAAADTNSDGSISKSDFIVYKLKEMGKITEKDLSEISDQFDALDC